MPMREWDTLMNYVFGIENDFDSLFRIIVVMLIVKWKFRQFSSRMKEIDPRFEKKKLCFFDFIQFSLILSIFFIDNTHFDTQ